MTILTNIQGTQTSVSSLEINVDTVYIRSNIVDIHTDEIPVLWQYDEIQMTLNEYLIKRMQELEEKFNRISNGEG